MVNDLLILEKEKIKPEKPTFMIAGFHQWANAGNVSSGIPEYLIEKLHAVKVGHIRKGDFYLFQLPGSHFMFRPAVKYIDGYEEDYQEEPLNDYYCAEISRKNIIIFIGTEPNQHEDVYVNALLDGAKELGIRKIVIPSGVGDEVPFDKERLVGCNYSLRQMHEELKRYAFTFSNYDRNATIGMVINHFSKARNIECVGMTARTPSYQLSISINTDKRAIYDILRRIRHMFGVDLDLTDLEKESKQQITDFKNAITRLCMDNPELEPQITIYMKQIGERFKESIFEEPIIIPDVFLKEFDNPQV